MASVGLKTEWPGSKTGMALLSTSRLSNVAAAFHHHGKMLLDINRKQLLRSERVKAVDFHPTEPWLITALYTGNVVIYHIETGAIIKTFPVTEVPVRCVKFIARRNWFVAGSDDFHLRIFNYNTGEKVAAFEAHPDYIRCLAVHPTLPLVLTGSDDMTVKLWDWEKGWRCVQVYEGHTHYIMNVAFNPKDANTFASACLDRTVKIWSLGSPTANYTLDAHEKGVNYVDFYPGGDKPYLITTGDDRLIKIWDYLSKSCVQTLEGHVSNVSFALFHPSLPLIISGSEDGTVKLWHASTYRLENTLDYGLERAWCVAANRATHDVAFGFDEGSVIVKLGKEEPSVSMDASGKVVFVRDAEVKTVNLAGLTAAPEDGKRILAPPRDLGTTDLYAQAVIHSPNGRFVTVCGDGEYVVYTALAWRNKAFGAGVGFAWAADSTSYAVREAGTQVRVFRNFKERTGLIAASYTTDGLFGGPLLCVKGMGFVVFYDWETGTLVRRIEIDATGVYWAENGSLVAITSADAFYILRFDRDVYDDTVAGGVTDEILDEGVEAAFEVIADVPAAVQTASWVGECFVYTSGNTLAYVVGTESQTLAHLDSPLYLLGFLPDRVYLCDKDVNLFSYALSLAVLEYESAILRKDFDGAAALLPTLDVSQRNRVARFLQAQHLSALALDVSTDEEHRFDLAVEAGQLDTALEIARRHPAVARAGKWRALGDRALAAWDVSLATQCYTNGGDLASLFLIHTSTGDKAGLEALLALAIEQKQNNIAFNVAHLLGRSDTAVELLLKTDRAPEAALYARTYAPALIPNATRAWKGMLVHAKREKLASNIATVEEDRAAFPEMQ